MSGAVPLLSRHVIVARTGVNTNPSKDEWQTALFKRTSPYRAVNTLRLL
jgi:hypothetical protein